jgi:hypothetical protein
MFLRNVDAFVPDYMASYTKSKVQRGLSITRQVPLNGIIFVSQFPHLDFVNLIKCAQTVTKVKDRRNSMHKGNTE